MRVPDPIVDRADGTDPEHEALLADAVGLALLVVLETLTPAERLAFVLHDMFAVPFDEIAPIVDRSPEAARQLASRARRRVQGEHAEPDADLDAQREVVDAFLAAARDGDFEALLAVLDPDVVLRADLGPRSRAAARGPRGGGGRRAGRARTRASAWSCGRRWSTAPSGAVSTLRRRAVLGRRLHDQGRPDRRDRHPRRPRAAAAAGPHGRDRPIVMATSRVRSRRHARHHAHRQELRPRSLRGRPREDPRVRDRRRRDEPAAPRPPRRAQPRLRRPRRTADVRRRLLLVGDRRSDVRPGAGHRVRPPAARQPAVPLGARSSSPATRSRRP